MPVVQVSHAPSKALYEEVANHVNMNADRPAGLILHCASEGAGGEVEIVDVWESAEALDHFAKQRLFPAFEAAGVMQQVMAEAPPVAHEPFHYVT
ncbi:MAG: hypothetical protein NVSMB25_26200 [Thermoleophilaceae bacterium]